MSPTNRGIAMKSSWSLSSRWSLLGGVAALAALTAGCEETPNVSTRSLRPIPPDTLALMDQKGVTKSSPVLIRAYKKEAELEIWKQKGDGRYVYLKSFPMCRWSGQLGPKIHEGDRQVPEGFYTITPSQMNPNSNYYLSFNVGYPNAYDRAYGYSGGSIMVHGACSSAGCFSMTDEQIAEIYALAREAFAGGQKAIQMQSLPFRMTAENWARHRLDPNANFWHELKEGSDHFEVTKLEPTVAVCGKRYIFDATPVDPMAHFDATTPCPPLQVDQELQDAVAAKQQQDDKEVAELVSKGVKPIRLVYADGGQNPSFSPKVSAVSPDTLAAGPREIELDEKTGKPVVLAEAENNQRLPKPSLAAASERHAPRTIGSASATKVAKTTAPPAAAPSTAVAEATLPTPADQPFYKRWFNAFAPAPPTPPAVAATETAVPQPDIVPLPPRRQGPTRAPKPAVASKPKPVPTKPTETPAAGTVQLNPRTNLAASANLAQ
jgi:murein L,D-transpeptidase YafK